MNLFNKTQSKRKITEAKANYYRTEIEAELNLMEPIGIKKIETFFDDEDCFITMWLNKDPKNPREFCIDFGNGTVYDLSRKKGEYQRLDFESVKEAFDNIYCCL